MWLEVSEHQVKWHNDRVGCVVEPGRVELIQRLREDQLAAHDMPNGPEGVDDQAADWIGEAGEHHVSGTLQEAKEVRADVQEAVEHLNAKALVGEELEMSKFF